jgi:hypothetical protein
MSDEDKGALAALVDALADALIDLAIDEPEAVDVILARLKHHERKRGRRENTPIETLKSQKASLDIWLAVGAYANIFDCRSIREACELLAHEPNWTYTLGDFLTVGGLEKPWENLRRHYYVAEKLLKKDDYPWKRAIWQKLLEGIVLDHEFDVMGKKLERRIREIEAALFEYSTTGRGISE